MKTVQPRIEHPNGFPYLLYVVKNRDCHKYVVASTKRHAINIANLPWGKPSPVSYSALLKLKGHQGTHDILKSFGDTWVSKNSFIFFKGLQ